MESVILVSEEMAVSMILSLQSNDISSGRWDCEVEEDGVSLGIVVRVVWW